MDKAQIEDIFNMLPVGFITLSKDKNEIVYVNRVAKRFYKVLLRGDMDDDRAYAASRLAAMFLNKSQRAWGFLYERAVFTVMVNEMSDMRTISIQRFDTEETSDNSRKKKIRVSGREEEIARLLLAGYSSKEIAEALFISIFTVNKHLENLFEKTGTNNRIAAASRALGRAV